MIHFHYSHGQFASYWLLAGAFIGYALFKLVSERRIRMLLALTAAFLLGAFIGGYYSWFAGVNAQLGTCQRDLNDLVYKTCGKRP